MCTTRNIIERSKKDLLYQIKSERQELAKDSRDFYNARNKILAQGRSLIQNPVATINEVLATRLSSRQRWEALGIAFIIGGALVALRQQSGKNTLRPFNTKMLTSNVITSLKADFANKAQTLGHRLINELFERI